MTNAAAASKRPAKTTTFPHDDSLYMDEYDERWRGIQESDRQYDFYLQRLEMVKGLMLFLVFVFIWYAFLR